MFARAAITNFHSLGSLKKHKQIVSKFWRLDIADDTIAAGVSSL